MVPSFLSSEFMRKRVCVFAQYAFSLHSIDVRFSRLCPTISILCSVVAQCSVENTETSDLAITIVVLLM